MMLRILHILSALRYYNGFSPFKGYSYLITHYA